MFERGKIVLVPFPFTDLSSTKVRPALIVFGEMGELSPSSQKAVDKALRLTLGL